jgi:O-antigen ligase
MNSASPIIRRIEKIDRLYLWLFAFILGSQPFLDNFWPSFEGTKMAYRGSMALLAVVYIVQGFMLEWALWRWPGWTRLLSPLAYMGRTLAVFGLGLGILSLLANRFSVLGSIPVWELLSREFYWATPLVMAAILARRSNFGRLGEGLWSYPLGAARLFASLFFFWGLLSALASHDPLTSLKDFRDDLGGALAAFLILLDVVRRRADARWLLGVALAVATHIAAINMLAYVRFSGGDEIERLYWIQVELIYSDDYWFSTIRPQLVEFDYRPAFPFRHHNRLSNYAMMASGAALILLAWSGWRWRARLAAGVAFAASFEVMNLTLGRGAWLSFAAGLLGALVLLFQRRRPSHWIALALLIALIASAWVVLPARQKKRLLDLGTHAAALAESARRPPTDPLKASLPMPQDGNLQRRLIAFETALRVIREHPWTGIGYGYHNYASVSRKYRPQDQGIQGEIESEIYQSHSHNNLLQVAAEMGLPGLGAYLGLHLTLFLLLAAAARRAHRFRWPSRWPLSFALALFLMAHAYGMTNYSLRYAIGDFFWLIMALLAVLAARAGELEESFSSPERLSGGRDFRRAKRLSPAFSTWPTLRRGFFFEAVGSMRLWAGAILGNQRGWPRFRPRARRRWKRQL